MKVCCLIGCPPGDPCPQAWGAMESRPRREAVLSERPNLARLQAAWCTPGCNVPSRLRYRRRQLLGLPAASAWPEEEQTREVSTRSFSRYRCCLVAGCPTTTPASQKRTLRSPFRKPLALAMGFLTPLRCSLRLDACSVLPAQCHSRARLPFPSDARFAVPDCPPALAAHSTLVHRVHFVPCGSPLACDIERSLHEGCATDCPQCAQSTISQPDTIGSIS